MKKSLGRPASTFYFHKEGRTNLGKTLKLVVSRAEKLGIRKIVVFTRDGDTVLSAARDSKAFAFVAVTFPYKMQFGSDDDPQGQAIAPGTSDPKIVSRFKELGIPLVRGTMPFHSIIIPYVRDPKLEGIKYALNLFGGGMALCVQAVLMATDAGEVEPGEEVVSMSADTAIVATGASSHWLFHPQFGMEIREIICKPRVLTVVRDK